MFQASAATTGTNENEVTTDNTSKQYCQNNHGHNHTQPTMLRPRSNSTARRLPGIGEVVRHVIYECYSCRISLGAYGLSESEDNRRSKPANTLFGDHVDNLQTRTILIDSMRQSTGIRRRDLTVKHKEPKCRGSLRHGCRLGRAIAIRCPVRLV
jgi:hypothetical protein